MVWRMCTNNRNQWTDPKLFIQKLTSYSQDIFIQTLTARLFLIVLENIYILCSNDLLINY